MRLWRAEVAGVKTYSRPAIEFQASIRPAALFRVLDDVQLVPLRGKVLTVHAVLKATKNPDNYLYDVLDDEGHRHEIRSWWLRRCTYRIINPAPSPPSTPSVSSSTSERPST